MRKSGSEEPGIMARLSPGIGGNAKTGGWRSVLTRGLISETSEQRAPEQRPGGEKLAAFANAGVIASTKPLKGAISQDFIVNYPFEC
jgi:hypothetical protein